MANFGEFWRKSFVDNVAGLSAQEIAHHDSRLRQYTLESKGQTAPRCNEKGKGPFYALEPPTQLFFQRNRRFRN